MKEIVSVSVTRTSDAVVNLKKVASLDSSRPLINLFKWGKVSPSAAVRGVALRREITLTLVGIQFMQRTHIRKISLKVGKNRPPAISYILRFLNFFLVGKFSDYFH